jgi:hypothetical protein
MTDEPPPDCTDPHPGDRFEPRFEPTPLNTVTADTVAYYVGTTSDGDHVLEYQSQWRTLHRWSNTMFRVAWRPSEANDAPGEPSPTPTTSTFAPRERGWTAEEAAAALTNHQRPRTGRRPGNEQAP